MDKVQEILNDVCDLDIVNIHLVTLNKEQ
jgi:hypothetical protein